MLARLIGAMLTTGCFDDQVECLRVQGPDELQQIDGVLQAALVTVDAVDLPQTIPGPCEEVLQHGVLLERLDEGGAVVWWLDLSPGVVLGADPAECELRAFISNRDGLDPLLEVPLGFLRRCFPQHVLHCRQDVRWPACLQEVSNQLGPRRVFVAGVDDQLHFVNDVGQHVVA